MDLVNGLANWDGKDTAYLSALYQHSREEHSFLDDLLSLLAVDNLQSGATWLIKAYCADGGQMSEAQVELLYSRLLGITSWQAKLHLLQSMSYIVIPDHHKSLLEHFARQCMDDKHTFVCAWSYHAFFHLANTHTEYRAEAVRLFDDAVENGSASVKARVRTLRKQGFD